ncbi:MAG: hypothetical protein N2555_05735 [Endomicrobia bacterium]|nr:hypothetical protein [Endomicrobiia bacterium]
MIKVIFFLFIFWNFIFVEEMEFVSFFPSGTKVGFILDLRNVFNKGPFDKFLFDVTLNKNIICIVKNNFFILTKSKKDIPVSFRIKNTDIISDMAILEDGSLFLVCDKKIGMVYENGFNKIIDLPYENIKIRKASKDKLYIFAKNPQNSRYEVFILYKSGVLLKLISTEGEISDVSGDGDLTFVAMGKQIFALLWGERLQFVYETDSRIVSLEFSKLLNGIFYSTENTIGYINKKYEGYTFIKNETGNIRIKDGIMYIYLNKSKRVLICEPISKFEVLTDTLKSMYKKEKN